VKRLEAHRRQVKPSAVPLIDGERGGVGRLVLQPPFEQVRRGESLDSCDERFLGNGSWGQAILGKKITICEAA